MFSLILDYRKNLTKIPKVHLHHVFKEVKVCADKFVAIVHPISSHIGLFETCPNTIAMIFYADLNGVEYPGTSCIYYSILMLLSLFTEKKKKEKWSH